MRQLMVVGIACWGTILSGFAAAAEPVAWMPADVNAVVRIDVASIYQTPLAKKEGWLKKATESFIQQEAFIPPGTLQILVGAQLDLSERLTSQKKYTILVPEGISSVEKLSDWLPGGIQRIGGKPGAAFGDDGFVVDSGDGCWLATTQCNRQTIARWVQSGPATGESRLSPYLYAALDPSKNPAQAVMAIDLRDNFAVEHLRTMLDEEKWFPTAAARDQAADTLASVVGATISISFDADRKAKIVVDFAKDAAVLKPVLQKLISTVVQKVGASEDDLKGWKWHVDGQRVVGSGELSAGRGRRLLSILEPPSVTQVIPSAANTASPANTPANATKEREATASLKYCKSLKILLEDLRESISKVDHDHALWFERYARKIDDLPRLYVNNDLLDYSAKVSSSLRYQGQTQRMANIRGGTRASQSVSSAWYYGNSRPDVAASLARREENQGEKEVRFAEWKAIEDGLAEIRRKLTALYEIEF